MALDAVYAETLTEFPPRAGTLTGGISAAFVVTTVTTTSQAIGAVSSLVSPAIRQSEFEPQTMLTCSGG
jgi:hypothetical protein